YNKAGQQSFHSGLTTIDISTINKWHRVSGNLKLNDDIDFNGGVRIYIYAYDFTTNSILYLTKPQLEEGTVATTFSLAQETIRSEIAEYKRTADKNYAGLQSTVSTLDGKVTQNKTEANQTATQLSNRLTSLETYKDGESTRAQAYFEASKAETAKQLTAERTAISANYVAKSTYDENVRGTTLKLNEIKTTADTAKQNLATYQETVDRKLTELTSSTQMLDGKINTASSKVDTVAGQIRTEISEVEGKIPTEIGGRNYFRGYKNNEEIALPNYGGGSFIQIYNKLTYPLPEANGKTFTISFEAISPNGETSLQIYNANVYNRYFYFAGGNAAATITNTWKKIKVTINPVTQTTYTESTNSNRIEIYAPSKTGVKVRNIKVELGTVATDWSPAPEDFANELSSVKTTITQTSRGVEQLSTSLATTDNKVTTAETKIRQLISDVSSKVSQTDYNTLTGRVDSAETAITQNAQEISKRLTSTQVESAITGKGYQTKAQVDNNIAGRGYVTTTVLENKVRETADSFSRTISETRALMPSDAVNRNLLITNTATSNALLYGTETYPRPSSAQYPNSVIKDAIWVDAGAKYTFSKITKSTGDNYWRVSYLDSNYALVSRFARKDNVFTITIPANVKYMWVSYPNDARCKIEKGDKVTAYVLSVDDTATVTALHDVKDTVSSHTRTIGAVGETGSILDNVSKVTQTAAGLVQEVSGTNRLKTQVSTLAGSYAIKNLTSSGTVLNQLNLNKDGSVKIDGSLVQITGRTYIQDGVIASAKIAGLDAGKITTGTLDAARIKANSIDGSKLVFDQAFVNKMTANEALFKQLFAKNAFITSVQAVTLSASQITGGILSATNGVTNFDLTTGNITINNNQSGLVFKSGNSAVGRIGFGNITRLGVGLDKGVDIYTNKNHSLALGYEMANGMYSTAIQVDGGSGEVRIASPIYLSDKIYPLATKSYGYLRLDPYGNSGLKLARNSGNGIAFGDTDVYIIVNGAAYSFKEWVINRR
ncbi:hypothetical protein HO414_09745, partial [Streptococcus suis]|nr:hypothetical protein [Streptococcus suis]